jgi:drug/metabolite transporter (DMT)-like permease
MMLGWEQFNFHQVFGVLIAFLGCGIMAMNGGDTTDKSLGGGGDKFTSGFSDLMTQMSFLINCLGSSLYVLATKRVLATGYYESVTVIVIAWSYLTATFMMAVFGIVMSWSEPMSLFLCSDFEGRVCRVPPSAIPAFIWYIIMTSSSCLWVNNMI